MSSPATAAQTRPDGHSIGFTLGLIAFIIALGGVALAYAIDAAAQGERLARSGTLTRTLGATKLTIPAAWFREDAERADGFAKQVELTLPARLGPENAISPIVLTLLPRSRVRPSASLLDGVYLHQFRQEQLSGPPGLIGKPLVAPQGAASETVWYDALSPAPFVAKCIAPVAEGEPGRCLRTVHLGPGIAAIYAFDETVLMNWREFDAALHPLLKQIGVF